MILDSKVIEWSNYLPGPICDGTARIVKNRLKKCGDSINVNIGSAFTESGKTRTFLIYFYYILLYSSICLALRIRYMCLLILVRATLVCPRARDRDGQRQRVESNSIATEGTSSSFLEAGIVVRRGSGSLTTRSSIYHEPGSTPCKTLTTQSPIGEHHDHFTANQYIADCI